MSNTQEFEFDAFQDNFSLAVDEPSAWPSMSVELTYRTHPAEPDVGIFGTQFEVTRVTYCLVDASGEGEIFSDEDAFVDAVYALIGEEIEDTREAVAKVIRDQIRDWEDELEDE